MPTLDGKVAIITGRTSGIGARTAELFVQAGAHVVIAGRRSDKGEWLAAELGTAATFIRTDVTIEADVRAMVERAVERFGRVDCLFNNAGALPPSAPVASVDLADFDAAIAVHVRSVLAGMKYAAPIMIRQRSGSIINMASVVGIRAGIGSITYSTAKAAVLHMTRCAAIELGERGVRVNSVSPGRIVTGIFGKAMGLGDDSADLNADAVRAALTEILPQEQALPRTGTPEDVAQAALFLASADSSFVNGHDLVIDGGAMAGPPASIMRARGVLFARAYEQFDKTG
jgi:NAD(P)-dependent dehydrogenase (short-subunit alcohol dehydrogenase family)